MDNIVAIVQARVGSTRLPRKVLAEIVGKPLIFHVFDRVSHSKYIRKIVLATTTDEKDDELESWAKGNGLPVYRGSVDNVLERYYLAAKFYNADVVVRVTADDALKDPLVSDSVISCLLESKCDYVSNTITPSYPEGVDVEAMLFSTLERAHNEAKLSFQREHVTPYIWQHPDKFQIENIKNEIDYSSFRWTIDTLEDLEFVRVVYEKLYRPGKIFLMNDVIRLLEENPEIMQLMPHIPRNQGLAKSMREDT